MSSKDLDCTKWITIVFSDSEAQASCMARWPSGPTDPILLAWEKEKQSSERERERNYASGCCNSSCWSYSRHEHNDDLAAKRITHILARENCQGSDDGLLPYMWIVSWVSRRWMKLSLIFFFSIIWRIYFMIFLCLCYSKCDLCTSGIGVTHSRLEM